jgi:PhoH-like ATPase
MLNSFYEDGYIEIDYPFLANQYVIMRSLINSKHSALGRYDKKLKAVVQLLFSDDVWGIRSKNVEQSFAIDALLNDDIKLVSLVGIAGSGKTLISIAAALFKTLDEGKYDKILVSRPVIPMGKDIGYLPGTLEEKLAPWIQPIVDNLEFILGGDKHSTNRAKELIEQGMIKIEALTYIRGRSIPNQFILIDEAQNLSAHEIQTILTRVGEGTKIVLTGDPNQIDSPYLDATDNGLVHAIEKLKDNEIVASVTLTKGERSELADLAAKFL